MKSKPLFTIHLATVFLLSYEAIAQTEPFSFQAYAEQLIGALSIAPDLLATNEVTWVSPAVFSYGEESLTLVETESTAPQLRQSFKALTNFGTPMFSMDFYSATSRLEALQMLCIAMGAPSSLPPTVLADSFCTTNLPSSVFVAWETNFNGTVEATYLTDGKNVLHVFDSASNSVELINSLYQSGIPIVPE